MDLASQSLVFSLSKMSSLATFQTNFGQVYENLPQVNPLKLK